jgi:hypothetical protein
MSKLQASSVRSSIKTLLAQSGEETFKEAGGKKRNFVETIELQIGLKNYDPQRDKRFVSGRGGSSGSGSGSGTSSSSDGLRGGLRGLAI